MPIHFISKLKTKYFIIHLIFKCKDVSIYVNIVNIMQTQSPRAPPLTHCHFGIDDTRRRRGDLTTWPPLADFPSVSAPWIIDISLIINLSTQLEWSDANYEAGQLRGWLGLHCSLFSVYCCCRKLKKYIRHL